MCLDDKLFWSVETSLLMMYFFLSFFKRKKTSKRRKSKKKPTSSSEVTLTQMVRENTATEEENTEGNRENGIEIEVINVLEMVLLMKCTFLVAFG